MDAEPRPQRARPAAAWEADGRGGIGTASRAQPKHLCPSSCEKPASTCGSGRRKHWAHSSRVTSVFCLMGFVYSFVRPSRRPCSVRAGCCSEHWG